MRDLKGVEMDQGCSLLASTSAFYDSTVILLFFAKVVSYSWIHYVGTDAAFYHTCINEEKWERKY